MASRQFREHVRISSAEDFSSSYSPSYSTGTSDAVQSIVTSRKCWKTIKGKGEVVWPPQLEAALVEGAHPHHSCILSHRAHIFAQASSDTAPSSRALRVRWAASRCATSSSRIIFSK